MNIAILLSGGKGSRLRSDIPKQYITVVGRMIVSRCLERLCLHPMIDVVQVVAAEMWRDDIIRECIFSEKLKGFSIPGENRQLSILNGLRDVSLFACPEDVVLVHDAARPLVSDEMITACLMEIKGHDGVMPVLPMTDTVYYSADGKKVEKLLERGAIFAGQAPESFRLGKYLAANERLLPDKIMKINGSTEPAIMAGMDIAIIPGEKENFKITTRDDLERYASLLEKEKIG